MFGKKGSGANSNNTGFENQHNPSNIPTSVGQGGSPHPNNPFEQQPQSNQSPGSSMPPPDNNHSSGNSPAQSQQGQQLVPAPEKSPQTTSADTNLANIGGASQVGAANNFGAGVMATSMGANMASAISSAEDGVIRYLDANLETKDYKIAKAKLVENFLENVSFASLQKLSAKAKREKIFAAVDEMLKDIDAPLNNAQVDMLKRQIMDETLGFGPLEPLLSDPDVSDIMVNTHTQIYIEKAGKIKLTDVTFTSEAHLLNVIQKIVAIVGRTVDEGSPMVDARMPDGSRFNAIVPPLAIDGSLVSIRKFKKNKMPLSRYIDYGSCTPEMAKFLEVCGNIRLNIMVSGGTGSGKTTLLNALSGHIAIDERVVTIEDAAELQMHQPHVLRLETRPPNSEGVGQVTQRHLLKNALRMRPDRIILGEVRGDEIIDVLAAMNTGHDGSMATIHANSPRDCLSRMENLVGMSGVALPMKIVRQQIASALNMIVQIARLRDGSRRIVSIEEVVGIEGDVITTQQIFGFKAGGLRSDGKLEGEFFCTGIRPRFYEQAIYFNRDQDIEDSLKMENFRV